MTIEEVTQKRNVMVGIKFDSCSRELLGWAVFKVADPGDSVVAVHVRRNSGNADSKIRTFSPIPLLFHCVLKICMLMQELLREGSYCWIVIYKLTRVYVHSRR